MNNPAPKILVVEDDLILQKALQDKLKSAGFRVAVASDGQEALDQAFREKPALILLDIVLPQLSGVEVMRKLRTKDQWGRMVPVILLTNVDAGDETLNEVVKYEPAFYLLKSAGSFDEVVDRIKQKLKMTDN